MPPVINMINLCAAKLCVWVFFHSFETWIANAKNIIYEKNSRVPYLIIWLTEHPPK